VTQRLFDLHGRLPRAILLAVAVSFAPLPVAAAEERPATKPGAIKAAIKKIAVSDAGAARAERASASRRAQQSSPAQSSSFFKTKPGIIALVVMAVGTGYAVYSTQNDRITSPGKE
jgi:hypothetical protein